MASAPDRVAAADERRGQARKRVAWARDENAPAGLKSSAQGLFGAVSFGVGSAVSGLLGGPLLASIGGRGMFLVLGIMILLGLALAEGIRRFFPEKKELSRVVPLSSDK